MLGEKTVFIHQFVTTRGQILSFIQQPEKVCDQYVRVNMIMFVLLPHFTSSLSKRSCTFAAI